MLIAIVQLAKLVLRIKKTFQNMDKEYELVITVKPY